ncbi:nucleotidyltransferase domain-containing protein [Candidatus Woesearchaeota archaeon]|nr:nucleotidyltransferase domain-containing protein [Candidatus Woesearchaeota archaeon]
MELDLNATVKNIKKLDTKKKVKFIALFGSYAKGNATKHSDIDIAIYYDGDEKERFNFQILVSGSLGDKYDIHTFQELPLYVKQEIFKYGKFVYGEHSKEMYSTNFLVIKEFENFRRFLDMYYAKLEGEQAAKI